MAKTDVEKPKQEMCKCLDEVEQKAFDHMKEKTEKQFTVASVNKEESHFQRKALMMSDNGGWRLYFEYQFVYTPRLRSGDEGREKKKVVSIYPTFCPFCGKKFPEN